jgi:hypothetical protein
MQFLHGCNYPWSSDGTTVFYGFDFGMNVWGSHLGISTRLDAVRADFERMAGLGFTVARWFVFCDGRSGIEYDDRGFPSGLDSFFFTDLDAGLDAAMRCGMRVDLVLLDFHWMFAGITHRLADPTTGELLEVRLPDGRADVLLSAGGRDALIEHVVEPLVRRYGPRGTRADLGTAIAAYEFMNEPDFVVEEWERDLSGQVRRPLPFQLLAELVSRVSALVHTEHPGVLSTIGCARAHNLWAWDDDALGLDLLEVHSYPSASILGVAAAKLGMRREVLIGEFPAQAADEYLEFALASGYAGAWPWSFSGTDDQGCIPDAALRRFAERHPELVNPRALLIDIDSRD